MNQNAVHPRTLSRNTSQEIWMKEIGGFASCLGMKDKRNSVRSVSGTHSSTLRCNNGQSTQNGVLAVGPSSNVQLYSSWWVLHLELVNPCHHQSHLSPLPPELWSTGITRAENEPSICRKESRKVPGIFSNAFDLKPPSDSSMQQNTPY